MQFNSLQFLLFFPVVLAVYFVIPRKMRMGWLLIASYYFYMNWNPKYIFLLAFSTGATWLSGILMERAQAQESMGRKKLVLVCCLLANLAILVFFKYGNFMLDNLYGLFHMIGMNAAQPHITYLLPVGISFYTFQALGYIIDVYRGDIPAEHNLLRYALFVSFFPQLVAGPIERSKNLLGQLREVERFQLWNVNRIASGAVIMAWGFFLKMVISDRVAILVNTVFDHYQRYGSTELILAAAGFALQIYCDFSSYSLIAAGAARMMGFQLMENFNTPYFAVSVQDFWQRWHISLSSWFRDYLYIPLGGSRRGKLDTAVNKLLVFLTSGLWHGANWTFIAWGGLHGLFQVAGGTFMPLRKTLCEKIKIRTDCFSWRFLRVCTTFVLIDFAWIFFRSDSISDALRFIQRIFIRPTPWLLFNGGIYTLGLNKAEMDILVLSLVLLFLVDMIRYKKGVQLDVFLWEQNLWFQWFVVIGLIVLIFIYGVYGPKFDPQQFIYFQF